MSAFSFRRFAILAVVLAMGVGIGVGLQRELAPRPEAVAAVSAPAEVSAPVPSDKAAQAEAPGAVEVRTTFDNNVYPSLLLSLAAADPAFTRCFTVEVTGMVKGQSYQLELG